MRKRVFTQTYGVVGGLPVRDGNILLVREADGPDNGKWSHPAGWLDVGEDVVAAAKREVEEETGREFKPTHLLGIYSLIRNDLKKAIGGQSHALKFIFIGEISDTQPRNLSRDVVATKWFTARKIQTMKNSELRDRDIKQMVADYFAGKRYPLDIIRNAVQD